MSSSLDVSGTVGPDSRGQWLALKVYGQVLIDRSWIQSAMVGLFGMRINRICIVLGRDCQTSVIR